MVTPLKETLLEQAQQNSVWLRGVDAQIAALQQTGRSPSVADAIAGQAIVDGFRQLSAIYSSQLANRRGQALSRATWLAVGVAVVLSLLLVFAAIAISRRIGRRESRLRSP
ncbi:MAG: hypothetical protein M3022_06100 [Actinomycetota bacterium]|nr:hypothetical protein [Actinomycetota bacterium]